MKDAARYTADMLGEYAQENEFTFRMVMDTRAQQLDKYKIPGFPALYLLDADGKVMWRRAGSDMRALRTELSKRGIK